MRPKEQVLPVVIVHVLAYECVGLNCAICVHLRYIQVINEANHLSSAWGAVDASSFLLKRLFQNSYTGRVTERWALKGLFYAAAKHYDSIHRVKSLHLYWRTHTVFLSLQMLTTDKWIRLLNQLQFKDKTSGKPVITMSIPWRIADVV